MSSGLTRTPTIIPILLQKENSVHETRHKLKYQSVRFSHSEKVEESVSHHYHVHTIHENTSIVGCKTHDMTHNDTTKYTLRLVLPDPSSDNAGHVLYIKDEQGKCGNGGDTNYHDNRIHIVHGSSHTHIHDIDVGHGYEIVYSTGTHWKLFMNDNTDEEAVP